MEEYVVPLDIPADENGFIDRMCPEERCGRYFKILDQDMESSTSPTMTCPFCGATHESTEFNTFEQQEYIQEVGEAFAQQKLREMLGQFADTGRTKPSSNSLLRIDVTTSLTDIPVPVSPEATEAMRLEIQCEHCNSTFAVVGAGFFCPFCGRNSASHTILQAITKTRIAVSVAQNMDNTLPNKDHAAVIRQDLLESKIEGLVTSFQRFAEAVYPDLPNYTTPPKQNQFQRMAQASKVWEEAGGQSFESILGADDWSELLIYYEKRHLLSHQDGFVDGRFIEKTGLSSYQPGEKLVISESDVMRMADKIEKLASGMMSSLPSTSDDNISDPCQDVIKLFPAKLPGTTNADWEIFEIVCELAKEKDHNNLHRRDLELAVAKLNLPEEEIKDSLEILEDKGLIGLSYTMGSRMPSHTLVTSKALRLYFNYAMSDYATQRKEIANLLLDNIYTSSDLADKSGLSMLFVLHILQEFESRGWISKIHWSGGIAVTHVTSGVHLKRLS